MRQRTEYEEQCAVIRWARAMAETGQEPRLALLHGDSSGVRVSVGAAVKMKRAGAIKGWPDLMLAVPQTGVIYGSEKRLPYYVWLGLFLELKRRKNGVISPEQATIHKLLRDQGYRVVVCKGSDEAIDTIKVYLGIA